MRNSSPVSAPKPASKENSASPATSAPAAFPTATSPPPRRNRPDFRRSRHGPPAHRTQTPLLSGPRYKQKDRRKENGFHLQQPPPRRVLRRRGAAGIEGTGEGRCAGDRARIRLSQRVTRGSFSGN